VAIMMSVKITVFSNMMLCTTSVHTVHLKVEVLGLSVMLVPLLNHMASECYACHLEEL
jgi:hypothetical protein